MTLLVYFLNFLIILGFVGPSGIFFWKIFSDFKNDKTELICVVIGLVMWVIAALAIIAINILVGVI